MIIATKMIVVAAHAVTVLHVSVAAIGVSTPLYGGISAKIHQLRLLKLPEGHSWRQLKAKDALRSFRPWAGSCSPHFVLLQAKSFTGY